MSKSWRLERIEKLIDELTYDLLRGAMEGDISQDAIGGLGCERRVVSRQGDTYQLNIYLENISREKPMPFLRIVKEDGCGGTI